MRWLCSLCLLLLCAPALSASSTEAPPGSTSSSPSSPSSPPESPSSPSSPESSSSSLLLTTASGTAPLSLRRAVDAAVAAAMSREARLQVISADDVRRRLELEGERQRAGCDDSQMSACIAEIKSALGVPWVMYVEVEVVGDDAVVGLSVSGESGGALSRAVLRTPANGSALLDDVAAGVTQVLRPLWQDDPRIGAMVGAAGVAVVVGSAAVGLGLLPLVQHTQASVALQRLREADGDAGSRLAEAKSLQASQGAADAAWQNTGLPLVIGGAVVVVAGVVGVIVGAGSSE